MMLATMATIVDPSGPSRSTARNAASTWRRAVALHRMLGGKPWQTSPVDADGPEPPDYIAADAMKVADWRRAWELRCALEKAAEQ